MSHSQICERNHQSLRLRQGCKERHRFLGEQTRQNFLPRHDQTPPSRMRRDQGSRSRSLRRSQMGIALLLLHPVSRQLPLVIRQPRARKRVTLLVPASSYPLHRRVRVQFLVRALPARQIHLLGRIRPEGLDKVNRTAVTITASKPPYQHYRLDLSLMVYFLHHQRSTRNGILADREGTATFFPAR